MNLVLLGLPGAGKGTHARKLDDKYDNIYHLSSGKLVRKAASQNTSIGIVTKRYINQGKLVPDKIVIKLMRKKIIKFKGKDFVFDGFPRNLKQVDILEKILDDIKEKVDLCIYLEVAEKSLIERLSARRICSFCGGIYNLKSNPPREEGVCDQCGGKLHQREDDKKEIVAKRIEENREKTRRLVNYYSKRGILEKITGTGRTPASIQEDIENIIASYNGLKEVNIKNQEK